MKKILMLLMISMSFSLAACNKSDEDINQPPVVNEPETPEVPETPETPETPENPETPETPEVPSEPDFERDSWSNEVFYNGFENKNSFGEGDSYLMNGAGTIIETNAVDGNKVLHHATDSIADAISTMKIPALEKGRLTWGMTKVSETGEISIEVRTSAGRVLSIHILADRRIAYRSDLVDGNGNGWRVPTEIYTELNQFTQFAVEWYPVIKGGLTRYYYEAFVYTNNEILKITHEPTLFDPARTGIPTQVNVRTNKTNGGNIAMYDQFILQDATELAELDYISTTPNSIDVTHISYVRTSAYNVKVDFMLNITATNIYFFVVGANDGEPTETQIRIGASHLGNIYYGVANWVLYYNIRLAVDYDEYDIYVVIENANMMKQIKIQGHRN